MRIVVTICFFMYKVGTGNVFCIWKDISFRRFLVWWIQWCISWFELSLYQNNINEFFLLFTTISCRICNTVFCTFLYDTFWNDEPIHNIWNDQGNLWDFLQSWLKTYLIWMSLRFWKYVIVWYFPFRMILKETRFHSCNIELMFTEIKTVTKLYLMKFIL